MSSPKPQSARIGAARPTAVGSTATKAIAAAKTKTAPAKGRAAIASAQPAATSARRLVDSMPQLPTKVTEGVKPKVVTADKLVGASIDAYFVEREEVHKKVREVVENVGTLEDAFRQTGRTTRMVEAAARRALDRVHVYIVMKDEASAQKLSQQARFYADTAVSIVSHNPKQPLFDWAKLAFESTGTLGINGAEGAVVFVDHAVVYAYNRNILSMLGWGTTETKS